PRHRPSSPTRRSSDLKPAGSAEKAALRTPPGLGALCAKAGQRLAPSRLVPVRLKAPKVAERPSRCRRLMRLASIFMCFLPFYFFASRSNQRGLGQADERRWRVLLDLTDDSPAGAPCQLLASP